MKSRTVTRHHGAHLINITFILALGSVLGLTLAGNLISRVYTIKQKQREEQRIKEQKESLEYSRKVWNAVYGPRPAHP